MDCPQLVPGLSIAWDFTPSKRRGATLYNLSGCRWRRPEQRRGAEYHPSTPWGGIPPLSSPGGGIPPSERRWRRSEQRRGAGYNLFLCRGRYHPVNAVGGDPNNAGGRYTTHSMIYERRGAVYHPTKPGKWYALTDGMVNFLINQMVRSDFRPMVWQHLSVSCGKAPDYPRAVVKLCSDQMV